MSWFNLATILISIQVLFKSLLRNSMIKHHRFQISVKINPNEDKGRQSQVFHLAGKSINKLFDG